MSAHNSPMSADFGNNFGGESASEASIDPPAGPLPQSNAGGIPIASGTGTIDPIDSGAGAGAIDHPTVLPPSILDGPPRGFRGEIDSQEKKEEGSKCQSEG